MPDYIAPGVFVEETSFRSKAIEGVSTTVTAFIGPTRSGPIRLAPVYVTSLVEFERIYGGSADLGCTPAINYLAHGVRAFFAEGGSRLYVARVTGKSQCATGAHLVSGKTSRFIARFPGAAGNGRITVQVTATPAPLAVAAAAVNGSLLRIKSTPPALLVKLKGRWRTATDTACTLTPADEATGLELLTLQVTTVDADGHSSSYGELGLDARHPRYLGTVLNKQPASRADQVSQLFAFDVARSVRALDLLAAFAPDTPGGTTKTVALRGGTDVVPTLADYKKAFALLADLPDVSIVAAPGHTAYPDPLASGIASQLVAHAEQLRYRIAVLDSPAGQGLTEVQQYRSRFDSTFAALYYPWVVVANPAFSPATPAAPAELVLPPSAFLCGIYARSDAARGVYKAPANEVVLSALRFERTLTNGEQEVLNPLGINCLRSFTGRGNLVWGGRTVSSDPEWKYVNIRRYFLYLEASIDRGTQWAVFEPNNERLWANVRGAIENFLLTEWQGGALLGAKPAEAYFVRCDRTTMTQNDLDNGRLVCLVGVAVLKPAEFVIFRLSQHTADVTA